MSTRVSTDVYYNIQFQVTAARLIKMGRYVSLFLPTTVSTAGDVLIPSVQPPSLSFSFSVVFVLPTPHGGHIVTRNSEIGSIPRCFGLIILVHGEICDSVLHPQCVVCDTMTVERTLLVTRMDGNRKQLTLDRWVYEALKEWANKRNSKTTKGMILYELMMDTYGEELPDDELAIAERRMNDELDSHGFDSSLFNKVKSQTRESAREELRDIEENPDERMKNVKIWVAPNIDENVPWERGWSRRIEEAVVDAYASAFSDRCDRIRAKEDLLTYLEDGRTGCSHDVVSALTNHETDDLVVHKELVSQFETEWWQRDDLQYTDMIEKQKTEESLSRYQWEERYEAFHTARQNYGASHQKMTNFNMFKKIFDLKKRQAKKNFKKYTEEYNVDWKHPIESELTLLDFQPTEIETAVESVPLNTMKDEAMFFNRVFEYYIEKKQQPRIRLTDELTEPLYRAGLISENDAEVASDRIQKLKDSCGLDNLKAIDDAEIYLRGSIVSA